jgi:hypothetical protein
VIPPSSDKMKKADCISAQDLPLVSYFMRSLMLVIMFQHQQVDWKSARHPQEGEFSKFRGFSSMKSPCIDSQIALLHAARSKGLVGMNVKIEHNDSKSISASRDWNEKVDWICSICRLHGLYTSLIIGRAEFDIKRGSISILWGNHFIWSVEER